MPLSNKFELDEVDAFDDIDDSDYIFIVGKDGNLKSLLLPDGFENDVTPDNVAKIMQIFEMGSFYSGTIH
jgi:hypothetical protein